MTPKQKMKPFFIWITPETHAELKKISKFTKKTMRHLLVFGGLKYARQLEAFEKESREFKPEKDRFVIN